MSESFSAESCFKKEWSAASTKSSGRESTKYLITPAECLPSQPLAVKTSGRKERRRDKEEESPEPAPENQRTEDRAEAEVNMEVGTQELSDDKSNIKEKERRLRRKKITATTGRKVVSLTLEGKQDVAIKEAVSSKDSNLESSLPEAPKTMRSGGGRSEGRKRLQTKIPEISMQSKRSRSNSNVKKETENSVPIKLHSAGQPSVFISTKEQELSKPAIEEEHKSDRKETKKEIKSRMLAALSLTRIKHFDKKEKSLFDISESETDSEIVNIRKSVNDVMVSLDEAIQVPPEINGEEIFGPIKSRLRGTPTGSAKKMTASLDSVLGNLKKHSHSAAKTSVSLLV